MAIVTPAVVRAAPAFHLMPIVPVVLAAAVAAGGCLVPGAGRRLATDEPALGESSPTGSGPPVNQTIPLELLFVRYAEHDEQLGEKLWQYVDEQVLPSDLRGRLAANGLRAGIIGGHLPADLAARFTGSAEAEAGDQLPTDARLSRRLIRLLPGRRGEIVTAAGVRELVLLEQAAGEVRGGTYRDASPLFAIEAKPAADGRVEVAVTPEIRHGPLEKSWVGEDGMFRLETGQRRHRLEHLQFTVTLPRESMLVVGCDGEDTATAGDCLLRDHDRGDRTSLRLVAVRPVTTAVDPLFAPSGDEVEDQAGGEPLVIH